MRDRGATQPPAHFHRNPPGRASFWPAALSLIGRKTTAGILPLRFAHPAKIRGGAAIPVTHLVHQCGLIRCRSFIEAVFLGR